jgi:hypothetical protein
MWTHWFLTKGVLMRGQTLKSLRWSFPLFLVLVFAFGVMPLSAMVRMAAPARVYVSPASKEALVGYPEYVEVRVDNVQDLFAVELRLSYDPSILDVTDADGATAGVQVSPGTLFAGLASDPAVYYNQVDKVAGTIHYVFSLNNALPGGVTGSGSLIRIDFSALQPGTSAVTFDEVVLTRKGGLSISRSVENGKVIAVLIPSTATPTEQMPPLPTIPPAPTATPTTPAPRPTVSIYIDPPVRYVEPGQTSWVDIRVANADELYGLWVHLSFDPRYIAVVDAAPSLVGTQLEDGNLFAGKNWYSLGNSADNVNGTIIYGVKLSFEDPAGTSGDRVARIQLRGVALGTSAVRFDEIVLTDREGVSLSYLSQSGAVDVVEHAPIGTITPTPIPPTPTTTATPTITPTPRPILYLEPDAASLVVGEEVDIDVKVDHVADLYGVEFHIDFNSGVIRVLDEDITVPGTQIGYGTFLTPDSVVENNVEDVFGRIHFAISQSEPTPPRYGGGVIAHFRVRALAQGASALAIHTTTLTDSHAQNIPHAVAGGLVAVNTRVVMGHVALSGRNAYGLTQITRSGALLAITGDDGEFVFACPANPGERLSFQAAHDKYLSAAASFIVPTAPIIDVGETTLLGGDIAGPQVVMTRTLGCSGSPTVAVIGPPDERINVIDMAFVASRFGAIVGSAEWEPSPDGCNPEHLNSRADLNNDQRCNIFDLVLVGNNFGASGVQPW